MCRCRDKGTKTCRGQRSEWTQGARDYMNANTKGNRRTVRTMLATLPIDAIADTIMPSRRFL